MIDKDLCLAGISTYRPYNRTEDEEYAYIQDYMLYELIGLIAVGNINEFRIAIVEYLTDDRVLYREVAEELLETQFDKYRCDVEKLLVLK